MALSPSPRPKVGDRIKLIDKPSVTGKLLGIQNGDAKVRWDQPSSTHPTVAYEDIEKYRPYKG